MDKTNKINEINKEIYSYLFKLESINLKEYNLEKLINDGIEIYRKAVVYNPDAEEMRRFYELLSNLEKQPLFECEQSFGFGIFNKIPDNILELVKIINNVNSCLCSTNYPLENIKNSLKEANYTIQQCSALERRLLLGIVNIWLDKIKAIENQKEEHEAHISIQLSPSLAFLDEKEENDGSVYLPIIITNKGPGCAYDLSLTVDGGGKARFPNSKKVAEDEFSFRKVEKEGIEPKLIYFIYSEEVKVELKGNFVDLIDRKKVEKYFIFPSKSTVKSMNKNKENPYFLTPVPNDKSVWDKLIYERDEALNSLFKNIQDKKVGFMAITGLRRTGKTTLLRYLCNKISKEKKDFLVVEIDCLPWHYEWEKAAGAKWSTKKFLFRVANAITQCITFKNISSKSVRLKTIMEQEIANEEISDDDFKELIDEIHANTKKTLLLAFDEADSLEEFVPINDLINILYLYFKTLVETQKLMTIFVHEKESIFWDNLWNLPNYPVITKIESMHFLTRDATIELATKPVELIYTPLAKEYLWRITGGYPAFIQYLCYHLIDAIQSEKINYTGIIHIDDLKMIVKNIVNSNQGRDYFDYLSYSISLEERRLLFILIKNGKIDPQTSRIYSLHADPLSEDIEVDWDVCKRYMDDWPEIENGLTNKSEIQNKFKKIVQLLKKKDVICYFDENKPGTTLRLRLGFFYSFINSL